MKKQSMRVYDIETAKALGINEAIILQQIQYWEKKAKGREINGVKWIYMTYTQLNEQFPHWCLRTVKNIVSALRKKGAIETKKEHELVRGSNGQTLHYRSVKVALLECKNDTERVQTLHPKSAKVALAYNTDTTTKNTRKYIQKRSVPFLEKKEEKKTLPKGGKKPRYVDGNMSRLFREAEKWLKEQPEDFQEYVGDYLKTSIVRNLPIDNQQAYARTIIIEIWKEQTNQEHNTSFRYDAEAIQDSLEQTEAQHRIGNIF